MAAGFEWDEAKRATNLATHGIDFEGALTIWDGPTLERRSDRNGEERYTTVGMARGRIISVAWTPRNGARRIISARAARRNERQDYAAKTQ